MKIGKWIWNELPNMNEARWDFGVYTSENRIYLIGGGNNTSIEYYDIERNKFCLLPNIRVPIYGSVCALIYDRIYVLGKQTLRVFDKSFKLMSSQDNINNTYPQCYSDVIVRGSGFIYLNNSSSKVYKFDSTSKKLSELKSF
jgi:hypothetical protein